MCVEDERWNPGRTRARRNARRARERMKSDRVAGRANFWDELEFDVMEPWMMQEDDTRGDGFLRSEFAPQSVLEIDVTIGWFRDGERSRFEPRRVD